MTKYYDIMFDLETTGTNPAFAGIIQIAAVRFNLEERAIDATDMFDRCLHLLPGRFYDESTRKWWLSRNRAVHDRITARAEPPIPVLSAFFDWVLKDYDAAEPIRLWSRPICFDWAMLDTHLRQIGREMPAHFRYSMDMNSYIRGLGKGPMTELYYTENESNHDALIDTLNQVGNLFAAQNHWEQK